MPENVTMPTPYSHLIYSGGVTMNIDMSMVIEGVTLTKVCSVKPDGDSTEVKQVTVNMKYDGLTLRDVFTKALSSDIIKWQASARKRFESVKSTENVTAKSPGAAPQVDAKTAIVNEAKAAGIDTTDKKAMSDWLKAKFNI